MLYMVLTENVANLASHPRFSGVECVVGTPYFGGDDPLGAQFVGNDNDTGRVFIAAPFHQARYVSIDLYEATKKQHKITVGLPENVPRSVVENFYHLTGHV